MASPEPPTLRFSDQVDIHTFEADYPRRRRRKSSKDTMAKLVSAFKGEEVTAAMLKDAAKLFSENYGIWGEGGFGKPGKSFPFGDVSAQLNINIGSRVRMTADRLRAQCLPEGSRSTYVMVTIDGVLAGNAFACRWEYSGRQVCWVTQLVVHSDYRERRLATSLLSTLIDPDDDVFGIMSSHPAACKALAKAVGGMRDQENPFQSLPTLTIKTSALLRYLWSLLQTMPSAY